jgi:DNA-directed RNA polymerase subunit H (RpoH/RPB5)|uniref:RNA polymerase subunit H/Rpb5 C-terminal domain-containing protein n=1 Tax=viral metagenome TaxID=1070528 RepID=A0A6C0LFC6_9ZZZZ
MEIDRAIENLKSMLSELRGENIDEFEEHEVDINRQEFYNESSIIQFQTSDTTIIFALTKKMRQDIIDQLKRASKNNIDTFVNEYNGKYNIILIFGNDILTTPTITQLNLIDKILQKKKGMLQFFQLNELQFNPTKHQLVPPHRKLSTDETTEIMNKYLVKSKLQMPIILKTDVIAKWLGLKQGDIVEIIRYNENSGKSYYYRCCI